MVDATGETINAAAQAAFPLMVQYVLPVGVRGIVVAGLLAALMSSLAGAFNACSTLFTIDLYRSSDPTRARPSWCGSGASRPTVMVLIGHGLDPRYPGRTRACTTTCRACRVISPRRSSWCSSSACSGSA